MIVGTTLLILNIPGSNSLKEKRRVIKSLKDRIRSKFNVSVAEVGEGELWQRANIGVACVANDSRLVNQQLSKVVELVESFPEAVLVDYKLEIKSYKWVD